MFIAFREGNIKILKRRSLAPCLQTSLHKKGKGKGKGKGTSVPENNPLTLEEREEEDDGGDARGYVGGDARGDAGGEATLLKAPPLP